MGDRDYPEPLVIPRSGHQLSRSRIHQNALKVLNRLNRSGHRGFLVGGSVRDHLLGRQPKDYDIATDARPPQIRRLFRNSRIIGRRFRLAHIYFREGIIEVATFRRDPDPEAQRGSPGELLITDDNAFGTPAEDAFRRDFTVNALFYNIADFSVVDYVGGIADLEAGVIRVIGDPDLRFPEDPVRMTRACEMAARLGFTIDAATQEGIVRHAQQIHKAAPARLAEEIGQIYRCGEAARATQWMGELGLAEALFPELQAVFEARRLGLGDFSKVVQVLDRRAKTGDSVSEIGLYSCLLLPAIVVATPDAFSSTANGRAVRKSIVAIAGPLFSRLSLAKHKVEQVAQTVMALGRFERGGWRTRDRVRFARRPFFADALLVYQAWVESTGADPSELRQWRRVAKAHRDAVSESSERPPRRRRRRRRRLGKGRRRTG
ncbi:MAG: polynucleotide adenylyltransferase PcnB [Thermoanaerobaculia bacterium]